MIHTFFIDNFFVLFLVRSDPPAKWVLLVRNTSIELQVSMDDTSPESADTSSLPRRSSSSDNVRTIRRHSSDHTLKGNVTHHRTTKSDVGISKLECYGLQEVDSPIDDDDSIPDEGMFSMLKNTFTTLLFRKSPDSETAAASGRNSSSGQPATEDKLYASHYQRPLSKSHSSSHIKQRSWHEQSEYEKLKSNMLPYKAIYTPPCRGILRTQLLDTETINNTWSIDNCFDIFVHPLSLPDLYDYAISTQTFSFLVKLSLLYSQPLLPILPKREENNDERSPQQTHSADSSSVTTPILDNNHLSSSSNDRGILIRLASLVGNQMEQATTPTPPTATPTAPEHHQPTFHCCRCVVAHLHLSRTVRLKTKLKHMSSMTIEEASVSREGSTSPVHSSPQTKHHETVQQFTSAASDIVSVLPGHIVMSNFMRQLLGAESESYIVLEDVSESSRVNCRQSKVSIALDPIDPFSVSVFNA